MTAFMLAHSEFRTEGIILYWLAKPGAPWSPQSICTPPAATRNPATKRLTADLCPCHYCLPNILTVFVSSSAITGQEKQGYYLEAAQL